jgi:hypothetical protein
MGERGIDMTMFDYLHQHPWWGLVYLILICASVMASVAALKAPETKEESKKLPFDVEDRSAS